jgi:predicted nucleic acid-binding protein
VILLDTSVLSVAFRRKRRVPREAKVVEDLHRLFLGRSELSVPGHALQETLSGVKHEEQFDDLERRLTTGFPILLPTKGDFISAARLFNACMSKGVSTSYPDCMIATQTIRANGELYTVDDDFKLIAKHSPLRLFEPPTDDK